MTDQLQSFYDETFYREQNEGSLNSARVVLGSVFEWAAIDSVIDVGCGVAPWLRTALELGASRGVGVDGDHVKADLLHVDRELFRGCDLEAGNLLEALDGPGRFDLVICVEVAEHLSHGRAPGFVEELCALGDLVLFSAAIPHQGGTNHINEQWPGYWSAHFASQGFDCFDCLRQRIWNEERCEWWYAQNAMLFARRGTASHTALALVGQPVGEPLSLVHPRMFDYSIFQMQHKINVAEYATYQQTLAHQACLREHELQIEALRLEAAERERVIGALTDRLAAPGPHAEVTPDEAAGAPGESADPLSPAPGA